MPKSRHKKDQKKRSRARTQKVQAHQRALQKKMQEKFEKEMEKSKNKKFGIEEVDPNETNSDVSFEEIKSYLAFKAKLQCFVRNFARKRKSCFFLHSSAANFPSKIFRFS